MARSEERKGVEDYDAKSETLGILEHISGVPVCRGTTFIDKVPVIESSASVKSLEGLRVVDQEYLLGLID